MESTANIFKRVVSFVKQRAAEIVMVIIIIMVVLAVYYASTRTIVGTTASTQLAVESILGYKAGSQVKIEVFRSEREVSYAYKNIYGGSYITAPGFYSRKTKTIYTIDSKSVFTHEMVHAVRDYAGVMTNDREFEEAEAERVAEEVLYK